MNAQQLRGRLFRRGNPVFRPAMQEDMRWLWASYKLEGGEIDQDQFTLHTRNEIARHSRAYMAEDENAQFENGRGPIAVITADYDGWKIEPHMTFFPWATHRNRLKAVVGFLMYQRFEPDIGSIQLRTDENGRDFCKRLGDYLPLRVGGKIAGGRPNGADYIFYVRGKKHGNL